MLHAFEGSALGKYCVHFCDTVTFTEVLSRSKISYLFCCVGQILAVYFNM